LYAWEWRRDALDNALLAHMGLVRWAGDKYHGHEEGWAPDQALSILHFERRVREEKSVIDEKDLIFNEEDRPMHFGRPAVVGSLVPVPEDKKLPEPSENEQDAQE
jgi:hypothetical protein